MSQVLIGIGVFGKRGGYIVNFGLDPPPHTLILSGEDLTLVLVPVLSGFTCCMNS